MNKPDKPHAEASVTRRHFIKTTSSVAAGSAVLGAFHIQNSAYGQARSHDTLRLALVGCGGRGSGAADQALSTEGDVRLVAMADAFEDRLNGSLGNLEKRHEDKIKVADDTKFVGFDAYKKAIELADVVILATPPGFRPIHFEEAVRQGKHVFMEKPVATDAPGVRKVLEAAKEAKRKNLKVGVGLQRHHQLGYIETIKRLQDGAIGDIHTMRAYWNGNTPWVRRRRDLEKDAGRKLTEMEYQMRNWYFFNWICGDHITEQHIHNLDVINWLKGTHPVKAYGMGGREVRDALFHTDKENITIDPDSVDYGEIFDHHFVEFEYADGSRMFSQCRHINGCWNSVSEHAQGSKGHADISGHRIYGESAWRHRDGGKNPYQQEHDDLFKAIREDSPFNEAEFGAISTMTSIFGRMATYSGKAIEWDAAINSNISLMPKEYSWDAETPVKPNQHGLYPVAVPGKTVVI